MKFLLILILGIVLFIAWRVQIIYDHASVECVFELQSMPEGGGAIRKNNYPAL